MPDRTVVAPTDRRTLVSLAVQFVVNGSVYAAYVSRLPEIRDQAGVSVGALGVVLTVGSLAALAGSFFTATVIGRLGSKRVMIVGGLLYVCALPAIGMASSAAVLVAALIAMLLAGVFVDAAMNLQASVVSSRRDHPVMSRLHGLYSLGTIGSGLLATAVAAAGVSVSAQLWVVAVLLAVAVAVVGPGLLPEDAPHPEQARAPRAGRRIGWAAVALCAASALSVPLDIVPGEWATFRLTDDLNAGPALAAAAYAAFATGMTAGRFGGDALVARLGPVRLGRAGPLVAMAGLVAATLVPHPVVTLAGFLVAGLGVSVVSPILAHAAARAPGRPGAGFTLLFVGDRTAGLLTPLLVGTLANSALPVGTAMAVVALPCALALVVLIAPAVRQ